ncbi:MULTISPECIES: AraC family transcriptional regulator [Rhodovulum]|nr:MULTISPECIES: AraC family transcriptional regulator [Rhodovulum]RAP43203.1 hypothetical protein BYZ73_00370 [Rhodovulum viride]
MLSDPLTAIVRSLDLAGGVFLEGVLTAPWAILARISPTDCRPFMDVPKQVIAYHIVTEGAMRVGLEDGSVREAGPGDVVFLPTNARHSLASGPGLDPVPGRDLILPPDRDRLARISFGGGGDVTRLLCGFIAANAGPTPLLDALPTLLVIRTQHVATLQWIEASIGMVARELTAGRISSAAVMAQLAELLLVEALRLYLERTPRPQGWLAGMADPRIARALARIHQSLAAPVSVGALAAEAGMSRSAFVARFSDLMGSGPARYALAQRIEAARLLLRDTDLTAAEIAFRVGYEAPEAFSRSFKRETGLSPADWRAAQAP